MYCSISGCRLDSTTLLRKDKFIEINNWKTLVPHSKGDTDSFRSRFVRGDDRMALGKKPWRPLHRPIQHVIGVRNWGRVLKLEMCRFCIKLKHRVAIYNRVSHLTYTSNKNTNKLRLFYNRFLHLNFDVCCM